MTILDLLGQMLGTILKFIPRVWWCPRWMGGVVLVRGKNIREFGLKEDIVTRQLRGRTFVFWWPLTDTMMVTPVVRDVQVIAPQTLTTKDGKSIIASGVITYQVTDVKTFLVDNFQADTSVQECAAACLRDVIIDKTWEQIKENSRNSIDRALTKSAVELISKFGVTVEEVRLASLAEAKVYNLVGGSSHINTIIE